MATPDHNVLTIGLGRDFSSLRFMERRDDGQTFHSAPTLDGPQEATFQFGTVPTSMDAGSAVTVAEARAAVAEFQDRTPAGMRRVDDCGVPDGG